MTFTYALFIGLTVAAALFILITPHVLYATLGLLGVSLGMAAIYFLQGAAFVAVTCVLVYSSGFLVILLFSTLLLPLDTKIEERKPTKWTISSLVMVLWGNYLWSLVHGAGCVLQGRNMRSTLPHTSSIEELGLYILGPYALAFEWLGLTLLIAMVGATYLIRSQYE